MIVALIERKNMVASSLLVNARAKKAIYTKEPRRTINDRAKPDLTNLEYVSEYDAVLAFKGDHLYLNWKQLRKKILTDLFSLTRD